MSLLKNPNEINENVKLAGLIYGQPGVGKTTLLLSGPNPVLIDADQGMRRVEKRFQVPSLPLTSYGDFKKLLDSDELQPFETIVIDTLGKFIDRMGDYLMDQNPKYRQGDGSLTLKAYGAVRVEFQRVLRQVKDQGKFLFFGAHEREERDSDTRFVRPDVSGSAGKDLVKDLDFLGYMEMRGDKRTISFNPTEKYYAKNSLNLDAVIEVPNPQKFGNTFLQKFIIEQSVARAKADDLQNKEYQKIVDSLLLTVDAATSPETFDLALKSIVEVPVIWDSQRVAKHKLNDKAKALNIVYDKDAKKFKAAARLHCMSETPSSRTLCETKGEKKCLDI
jgi:hypothetical protein